MPQKKKDYYGNLYGIRLRTISDKKIKEILEEISKEKDLPLDKLILNYIEKGLYLSQKEEKDLNFSNLSNVFNEFFERSNNKIGKLSQQIEIEEFERKETLKNHIYLTFPNELKRNQFFLDVLKAQIHSEVELFSIFFALYDYQTNKFADYFSFYCNTNKIEITSESYEKVFNEVYQNLIGKLLFQWYYELKINAVITNIDDIKNLRINYEMLEKLLLNMYKGKKLLLSRKESRIRDIKKSLSIPQKKEEGFDKTFRYRMISLFRDLLKHFSHEFKNLFDVKSSYENFNIWNLFNQFHFKPQMIDKIINLDAYCRFMENREESMKAYSYAMQHHLLLVNYLNKTISFPPFELISQISSYCSDIELFDDFLKELQEQIKIGMYPINFLKQIGVFLKSRIALKDQKNLSKILIDKIKIKNIENLLTTLPNNYLKTIELIEEILKKSNIQLDEEYEKICNLVGEIMDYDSKLFNSLILKKLKEEPKVFNEYVKLMKGETVKNE